MSGGTAVHVGIRDLARVAARAIAVERVLFETFGRWITSTSDASAKPRLAATARAHAWHAQLWQERLPLLPDTDADRLVADERAGLTPLVDRLAAFDALTEGPGRLAAAGLAASRLAAAYRVALAQIDPLLDAPTAGVLTMVIADLGAEPAPTGALATGALATEPAPTGALAAGALAAGERHALDALRDAPFPTLGVVP